MSVIFGYIVNNCEHCGNKYKQMTVIMDNPVSDALRSYESKVGLALKPNRAFYEKVGINQKRFGQLLRGEKPIYGFEAVNLSEFFGVPLEALCKNESPVAAGNSAGQSVNV